jgi:hypothetical protein
MVVRLLVGLVLAPSTLVRIACLVGVLTASVSAQARSQAPFPAIVERASAYVATFAEAAKALVGDEHYVQEVKARNGNASTVVPNPAFGITVEKRILDSEVALVHIVDQQLWLMGRDVVSVDNRPLDPQRRQPLSAYHPATMPEAIAHFQQLATASARFNIGTVRRNLNVPTLALWFLTPGVRDRFVFKQAGQDRVDGHACIVMSYRERAAPYLLEANDFDVPVSGRFWIDRETGTVVKTEMVLYDSERIRNGDNGAVRAQVTVRYAYAPEVEAWAPIEMQELYSYPNLMNAGAILGSARYSHYKKFTTAARIIGD